MTSEWKGFEHYAFRKAELREIHEETTKAVVAMTNYTMYYGTTDREKLIAKKQQAAWLKGEPIPTN